MNAISVTAIHRARMAAMGMDATPPARVGSDLGASGVTFGDSLKQMLGEVSAADQTSRQVTESFLRGEPVEMHQVMAAAEEAGIAVEMLVEVRNKLIEAYRTLTNMQS
jgi:flagellar hook-basal body complex protein FliE